MRVRLNCDKEVLLPLLEVTNEDYESLLRFVAYYSRRKLTTEGKTEDLESSYVFSRFEEKKSVAPEPIGQALRDARESGASKRQISESHANYVITELVEASRPPHTPRLMKIEGGKPILLFENERTPEKQSDEKEAPSSTDDRHGTLSFSPQRERCNSPRRSHKG